MAKKKAKFSVLYAGKSAAAFADRIGKNPVERLAWVIRFAQTDLAALRPEERIALARDLGLFQNLCTVQMPGPFPAVTIMSDSGPAMPDATLAAIHAELAQGFKSLMDGRPWIMPEKRRLQIVRASREGSPQTRFIATWDAGGDVHNAVISAVARLLMEHGQKLRACPECRKVFVATRRQRYCDTRCSQRVRNQKRKEAEVPK